MKTAVVFSIILCLIGGTSSVAVTPPAKSPPSWFVRIYKKCEEKRLCDIGSGTLISQHMVLTTAASFFLKENMSSPQDIVVTLGEQDWTHKKSGAVKFKVREIAIAPQYSAGESFHLHNLALLNLKTSVTATPAQIDFGPRLRAMTPGEMTMITDKDGHPLYNRFVNVDEKRCRDKLNGLTTSYITRDKFCFVVSDGMTVSVNGSSVTIQRDGVYYVKGVVSERKESVLLVTSLENKELLKWLQRKMLKFDRVHNTKHCEGHSHLYTYNCPDDTYCCDKGREGCCPETNYVDFFMNAFIIAFIVTLVVVAICLRCSCCVRKRRAAVIVHSRPVGVVAEGVTPQTLQQGGYPSSYPQAQSAYPPPAAYNSPYYGEPPPEYQPFAPNPVENPQVVPL